MVVTKDAEDLSYMARKLKYHYDLHRVNSNLIKSEYISVDMNDDKDLNLANTILKGPLKVHLASTGRMSKKADSTIQN